MLISHLLGEKAKGGFFPSLKLFKYEDYEEGEITFFDVIFLILLCKLSCSFYSFDLRLRKKSKKTIRTEMTITTIVDECPSFGKGLGSAG